MVRGFSTASEAHIAVATPKHKTMNSAQFKEDLERKEMEERQTKFRGQNSDEIIFANEQGDSSKGEETAPSKSDENVIIVTQDTEEDVETTENEKEEEKAKEVGEERKPTTSMGRSLVHEIQKKMGASMKQRSTPLGSEEHSLSGSEEGSVKL